MGKRLFSTRRSRLAVALVGWVLLAALTSVCLWAMVELGQSPGLPFILLLVLSIASVIALVIGLVWLLMEIVTATDDWIADSR